MRNLLIILFLAACSTSKKSTETVVVKSQKNETTAAASDNISTTPVTVSVKPSLRGTEKESNNLVLAGASIRRSDNTISISFNEAMKENSFYFFSPKATFLSSAGKENLNRLSAYMQSIQGSILKIETFTDINGSASSNMAFTQRRAQAVASYLRAKGISPHRMIIRWYGESNPVTKNGSDPANRRLDLTLVLENGIAGK